MSKDETNLYEGIFQARQYDGLSYTVVGYLVCDGNDRDCPIGLRMTDGDDRLDGILNEAVTAANNSALMHSMNSRWVDLLNEIPLWCYGLHIVSLDHRGDPIEDLVHEFDPLCDLRLQKLMWRYAQAVFPREEWATGKKKLVIGLAELDGHDRPIRKTMIVKPVLKGIGEA